MPANNSMALSLPMVPAVSSMIFRMSALVIGDAGSARSVFDERSGIVDGERSADEAGHHSGVGAAGIPKTGEPGDGVEHAGADRFKNGPGLKR